MSHTIIAQCTPTGSGALALLRVSGPEALDVVARCSFLSSSKNILDVASHTVHHGKVLAANGTILDEVLFIIMHGPRTFTGENTVEITCHNNPFIIEAIIERIIECGARLAHNGEFSRQAVMNQKIDLAQAEAINDLIHAQSQEELKRSLCQVKGSLSAWIKELEKSLIKILALCEASFEFLEEDMDFSGLIRTALVSILEKIETVNLSSAKHMREGVRIALIGSVNAGKSSLFNALLGKKRAIVTPLAGTTRDVIEASFYQDGLYWTLIDTAGLRQTNDIIEQEGIERSYQEAEQADIVLLVIDGSRVMTPEEEFIYNTIHQKVQEKVVVIYNKNDCRLIQKPLFNLGSFISAYNPETIANLKTLLTEKIKALFIKNACPFLLNKRQTTLLLSSKNELVLIINMLNKPHIEYELIAHRLNATIAFLAELTGRSVNDKMLDTVFKEFCIGK